MSSPSQCQKLGDATKAILEILCKYKIPNLNINNLIEIITNDVKVFTYIDIDDRIKEKDEGKDLITDIMKSLVDNSQNQLTYRVFENMFKYIKELLDERYMFLDDEIGNICINYELLAEDIRGENF